jgi:hypothetical protein
MRISADLFRLWVLYEELFRQPNPLGYGNNAGRDEIFVLSHEIMQQVSQTDDLPEAEQILAVLISTARFPTNAARRQALSDLITQLRHRISPRFERLMNAIGQENAAVYAKNPQAFDSMAVPALFRPTPKPDIDRDPTESEAASERVCKFV